MFCGECGTRVQAEAPLPPGIQPLSPPTPKRGLGTAGKIAIVVILLLVLGVVAVIAFSVLGCGGCCLYFGQDAPLEITLDYPQTVKMGEKFTLRVTLRNTADGTTPLQDLGFDDSLMEGMMVLSSEPPIQRQDHLPTGVTTFWYYIDIPPGETTTITLQMQAVKVGNYEGTFTAFSDPGSKTTQMRFTVTP
jgi:hypothetical protein